MACPRDRILSDVAGGLVGGGGGTFVLRFAEVDNQLFFNQGVDNVSIEVVPAPASAMLGLIGITLIARTRRPREE